MKVLSNLRFATVLFLILFSCGKKDVDNPRTVTSSLKAISKNAVIVNAPEPPGIIPEDLVVAEENGASIGIISELEYNSLDYKDQVFYTGLRNSIVYLLEGATNERTLLTFNIDGSYSITSNFDDDEDDDNEYTCVQCRDTVKKMIANCMKKVAKYMEDNNKTEVRVKIKKTTINGDKCIVVDYKYPAVNDPDPTGGTILETFIPSAPPTFTNQQFDIFIYSTISWYSTAHPPVPVVWDAASLNYAIDVFIYEELSPAYLEYGYASQQGFVPAIKAYVSAHY